jgi:phosphate uptake regulator
MNDNNKAYTIDYDALLVEIEANLRTTNRNSLCMIRTALRAQIGITKELVLRMKELDKQLAKAAK